ncbi:hypothetical protein ACIHEI_33445 [Kitasatospora sp. NPDC051984]|uniref:hypothetical protein n=1 Tax=Kitasatospora sp. NPDC051984 TaxID=3364059 RepID=UPI0037CBD9A7
MSRRLATVLVLAAAALAATGCSTDSKQSAAPAAGATTPAAASASTSEGPGPACSAAPSPTESWMGGWEGPLPDEIRCLPHIEHGTYSHIPPAADVYEGGTNAVSVTVTSDTTRDQALAVCLRITELGYGLGGPHQVSMLQVSGANGHYMSIPGQEPCYKVH